MPDAKEPAPRCRPFDAANYMPDVSDRADLLDDARASGDPRYLAAAQAAAARAEKKG